MGFSFYVSHAVEGVLLGYFCVSAEQIGFLSALSVLRLISWIGVPGPLGRSVFGTYLSIPVTWSFSFSKVTFLSLTSGRWQTSLSWFRNWDSYYFCVVLCVLVFYASNSFSISCLLIFCRH